MHEAFVPLFFKCKCMVNITLEPQKQKKNLKSAFIYFILLALAKCLLRN